jgi:uncharacterized protein
MKPAEKKVTIVASYGPSTPERCPGAFLFAQEAAKLGAQVNLVFVLQAPLLLKQGIAETICAKAGGRTMRRFIDETLGCGVTFYVCDAALKLCDMQPEDLIEEVENMVGPSFLITAGLESDLVMNF